MATKSKKVLTADEQWRIVRKICEPLGINYEKMDTTVYPTAAGIAITEKNRIEIEECLRTEDQLISLVLHEVMHILAARAGKYNVFHNAPFNGKWTERDAQVYLKTAVFAEMYVDAQANRAAKKMFPHVKFRAAYSNKRARKILMRKTKQLIRRVFESLEAQDGE